MSQPKPAVGEVEGVGVGREGENWHSTAAVAGSRCRSQTIFTSPSFLPLQVGHTGNTRENERPGSRSLVMNTTKHKWAWHIKVGGREDRQAKAGKSCPVQPHT